MRNWSFASQCAQCGTSNDQIWGGLDVIDSSDPQQHLLVCVSKSARVQPHVRIACRERFKFPGVFSLYQPFAGAIHSPCLPLGGILKLSGGQCDWEHRARKAMFDAATVVHIV